MSTVLLRIARLPLFLLAAWMGGAGLECSATEADPVAADKGPGRYPKGSPVDVHGALQVIDRQLCDSKGQPVLLRGISSHDLGLFPKFTSRAGIRTLAGDWRVTVLRPALYVTSFYGNRSLKQQVDRYVDACEENGISWCNWSLSDADEDSALFKPGTGGYGNWKDSDLTASGQLVKARLEREPKWRPSPH